MKKTLEEIIARLTEIAESLENDELTEEEVNALEKEADELAKEQKALTTTAEKRSATLTKVRSGIAGQTVEIIGGENMNERTAEETYASKEYRSAFLKHLLGQEMTKEERAAFTHTTDKVPVPTKMLDEIWDLVSEEHSILEDITIYRTEAILEIEKHVSTPKGRAKKVNEGQANDDTEYKIVPVTLSGKDFSKTVKLSYAAKKMSLNAFEDYIKRNIATELGEVLAEDTIEQIKSDMHTDNVVGVEEANNLKYKDVTNAFGKLKRAKKKYVYVNNEALYSKLCGMVDDNNRPIFQPNANADAEGFLLGAAIRIEDAIPGNQILVGASKQVVMNIVEDILLEEDKDIETHKHIYSGYTRAESVLMYDKSFVLIDLSVELEKAGA